MILRAAAVAQPTNLQIGREWGCANLTGGQWRRRYLGMGFAGVQDARRTGRPRALAPPTRVQVLSVASTVPHDHERPVTRWTLNERVATLLEALAPDSISRSSLWRILHDVDLKPHKSAYGLNSHAEDCDAKAQPIGQLYAQALEAYQQGRLVSGCDAKTGRPILERTAPTKPAQAGRRERREPEYIRHGTRVLITALAVATARWPGPSGAPARPLTSWRISHRRIPACRLCTVMTGCWTTSTPTGVWPSAACGQMVQGALCPPHAQNGTATPGLSDRPQPPPGVAFHPATWLVAQSSRVLLWGVTPSLVGPWQFSQCQDFVRRLERFLKDDNTRQAHPYRWTSTGEP